MAVISQLTCAVSLLSVLPYSVLAVEHAIAPTGNGQIGVNPVQVFTETNILVDTQYLTDTPSSVRLVFHSPESSLDPSLPWRYLVQASMERRDKKLTLIHPIVYW